MDNLWSKKMQSTEDLYYSRVSRFNDNNKQEWFDTLNIKDGDKVLEVGCGGGHFCNMIKKHYPNCEVCGIDLDKGHIHFAKQKANELKVDVNYQVADIKNLPFKDNYFDIVYSYTVVEHLPFGDFIKEQRRILKDNGKIIIMGVATYENIHTNEFNFLLKEIDEVLQKLEFDQSRSFGKYVSYPEDIMKNMVNFNFTNCNFASKKFIYYNPDCQNDILISKKQINNEYISDNANYMFLLQNAKNGDKCEQQLLKFSEQRYRKRMELLDNNEKVFDYNITNVFIISAQKD